MRIAFVADYRSPIARQWIDGIAGLGHDVSVISSRPLTGQPSTAYPVAVEPLGTIALLQAAIGRHRAPQQHADVPAGPGWTQHAGAKTARAVMGHLSPLAVRVSRRRLGARLASAKPDLVHAMRLPYEGIAAAGAWSSGPVVGSIWGNDLTLHAAQSAILGRATRTALARLAGLHTDCRRDLELAQVWGFNGELPAIVLPGSGGVRTSQFRPGPARLRRSLGIPEDAAVVLNPRGLREYVHVTPFLDAVAMILARRPDVHVVCTGLRDSRHVRTEVDKIPGRERVHLLPQLTHSEMPDVNRAANVCVSLTSHDGTPNTLLEAMASGCFPVVGRVTSVLEWITHGENGFVVCPTDAAEIAAMVLLALDSPALRDRGREHNIAIIGHRAEFSACMTRAAAFYEEVVARAPRAPIST